MVTDSLRILQVIDTGGPGGAETVFLQLATGLSKSAIVTTAAVGYDTWLAERLRAARVSTIVLPAHGSFNVSYLRQLTTISQRSKPDVVIAHLLGPAVYCSIAGACTQTPVISIFHGQTDLDPAEKHIAAKTALIRFGSAACVFVSDELRTLLGGALRIHPNKQVVIENGIDLSSLSISTAAPLRASLNLAPDTYIVGSVGNIRPAKDYNTLLHAASIAIAREPRLRFVIAGDTNTPLYEELIGLRERLRLQAHVHFLGLRDDVSSILKAIDLFVISSSSEGFSIACCEAMGCGVPVVATRSGGPERILDYGRCGVLVPTADPPALAAAVIRMMNSPQATTQMSALAAARVRQCYGSEAMLDAYASLICRLSKRRTA